MIPGLRLHGGSPGRLYGLTETHIFSPNFVNEIQIGVFAVPNPRMTNDQNIKFIEQFGIQGSRLDGPPYAGVPQTSIHGLCHPGRADKLPAVAARPHLSTGRSLTWVRGRHTFKFGVDFHRFQTNGTVVGNGRGSFTFLALTATTLPADTR